MVSGCSWLGSAGYFNNYRNDTAPDGMAISIQCQQGRLLDFMTLNFEQCQPGLAPVWPSQPEDELRRKSATEF